MNSQELRNLQEAYMEVVENQQLDEKNAGDDLFKQFYRGKGARKVKGAKITQPGQNRYLAQQNQKRSAARYAADMGRDRTPSASDYDNHGGGSRNEQYDIYDIILSHLLDEGYASTEETADKIILNMSESWFEEIVEDYVVVKKDGSREIVKGDPPKAKKEPGGYDYTHTDKQKEDMKKTPKTKIGSRFD
jgi:hypothetical protein